MQLCHYFATSGCKFGSTCSKGSHDATQAQVLAYLWSIACPICVKHGHCTARGCKKSHAPEVIQRLKSVTESETSWGGFYIKVFLCSFLFFFAVKVFMVLTPLDAATAPKDSANTSQHGPTDFAEAARLCRLKAAQGDHDAEFDLGVMLREGRGVEKDNEQAVQWFRRAATQGHSRAQFSLGLMLQEGQGVAKDLTEALGLFRRAAQQNHPEAQFYLGDILENGRGVARDRKEAKYWYDAASQQGFTKATAALKRMQART
jgi:hypothetical protein